MGPDEIKQYVLNHLKIGDVIMAQADRYTADKDHGIKSKHKVTAISKFCILTKDEFNRPESYTFYDAYMILQNGGKVKKEDAERKDAKKMGFCSAAATVAETKEKTGDTEFPGNRQITEKGEEK